MTQLETLPAYLQPPSTEGLHLYGSVEYDEDKKLYCITGEPALMEMAKRVFPGSAKRTLVRAVAFPPTRRAVGDLNWLMQRFPLEILCRERFEMDRALAVEHAVRREGNAVLEPIFDPAGFTGKLINPYQGEGVAYLLGNRRCLLADDMGLGKTIQALAALAQGNLFPALIVGSASVQRQWMRLAQMFLNFQAPGELISRPPECINLKGLKGSELKQAPMYVTHYGVVRGWVDQLREAGFKAVIFDEIQDLRKTGSQKYSCCSLIAEGIEFVWGLSGTPIYNYGAEIWAVLNILDYHCLGDYEAFTREWCTGYGSVIVEKPDVLGDHLRREGLMLRRLKSEVQSQLPPKRRVVSIVGHVEDQYGKLIKHAVEMAKTVHKIESWAERGMAVRTIENEARQATGIAKAPMVADFTRTLLEAGERVLLFAYHHNVHDLLNGALKDHKPVQITGRESPKQKDEAIKEFADGKTNLVILSLRTTAGLDGLQGRGTCVVFGELDWSPAVHAQCEDRLQRIGVATMDSILCYYLVSDTGSDEVMQEALGLKVGQFVGIMGDTPETEDDKALAGRDATRHLEGIVAKLKGGK